MKNFFILTFWEIKPFTFPAHDGENERVSKNVFILLQYWLNNNTFSSAYRSRYPAPAAKRKTSKAK